MPLAVGDLTFLKADASPLRLAECPGKPLLLIFLRHLA
jgi:hypothetical protein